MTRTIIAATLALGLLGCGKGEGETKNEPATPTAQPTGTPPTETPPAETPPTETPPAAGGDAGAADPAGAAPEGSAEVAPEAAAASEVPTAEDFEEKAAKDVNQKNLESQVTEMEKELGAKPPAK